MRDEERNDEDETTEIDFARSSWIDPEFYKHSPCRRCGSTDVVPVVNEVLPDAEPVQWRCSACGELIP